MSFAYSTIGLDLGVAQTGKIQASLTLELKSTRYGKAFAYSYSLIHPCWDSGSTQITTSKSKINEQLFSTCSVADPVDAYQVRLLLKKGAECYPTAKSSAKRSISQSAVVSPSSSTFFI